MKLIIEYVPYAITFLVGMLSALLLLLVLNRTDIKEKAKKNSGRNFPGIK